MARCGRNHRGSGGTTGHLNIDHIFRDAPPARSHTTNCTTASRAHCCRSPTKPASSVHNVACRVAKLGISACTETKRGAAVVSCDIRQNAMSCCPCRLSLIRHRSEHRTHAAQEYSRSTACPAHATSHPPHADGENFHIATGMQCNSTAAVHMMASTGLYVGTSIQSTRHNDYLKIRRRQHRRHTQIISLFGNGVQGGHLLLGLPMLSTGVLPVQVQH